MSNVGHNSSDDTMAARIKSFVERIERMEAEKADLASDIRDIYTEAKGTGFDVKALRQIIRERKMDAAERQEREAIADVYRNALGMLSDTPLGEAAVARGAK